MKTETRVTVDRTTYLHFLRCAIADLGGICSVIASDTRRFAALACSGTAGVFRSIILLAISVVALMTAPLLALSMQREHLRRLGQSTARLERVVALCASGLLLVALFGVLWLLK